jgi:hypothetical protein
MVSTLLLCNCSEEAKLSDQIGSNVKDFGISFDSQIEDAKIFRFANGKNDAVKFAEKMGFAKGMRKEYSYIGMRLESPYYIRKDHGKSYLLVIGKLSGDEKWAIVSIDY